MRLAIRSGVLFFDFCWKNTIIYVHITYLRVLFFLICYNIVVTIKANGGDIMEKSATLNLRINPTLKRDAESVLSRLGIPMSVAVDMFLNQVVLSGGIPFSVT